jgi:hypothetical protein
MAEKRMIHRRIVESDKLRALANAGKYRACFYYAAFLPYYDRAGRMNANPMLLKGSLFEGYDVTVEDIEESLRDLANVGLIKLYRNGRHAYLIQCEKFLKEDGGFNTPHPKEPPSILPGPEDAGSALGTAPVPVPEVARNVPGNVRGEIEVYRDRDREIEVEKELLSAAPTRASDYTAFVDAWNEHRGNLPGIRSLDAKRKRAIDTLRKEHGTEALALFVDAVQCVAADDYWVEKQYGFTNLIVAGRVLEKADKWRAGPAQLGTANTRMAAQVHRWATALDALDERPVN